MYIHDAAKLANELGTGFHPVGEDGTTFKEVVIIPTDTPGYCVLQDVKLEFEPGIRWCPSLKKLLSDKYEVYGADGNTDPALLERIKEIRNRGEDFYTT